MKLILSAGLFLLAFASLSIAQPPNPYTFSPAVEITDVPLDDGSSLYFFSSGQHYAAFRGDTVYVVWAESRFSTPPVGNHVFFSKSTDKGATFAANVRVNSTAVGFNPSMRVDAFGIIYVAYERQANIFFTKSTDGGSTFSPAILVVDSAGLPYTQEFPSIAVNNKGQVFIAWIDKRTNPQSIFSVTSYDGGLFFGANVQASTPGILGDSPDIAADDSGRVFVVWDSFDPPNKAPTCLSRSEDSGQTFPFRFFVSDLPTDTSDALALSPSLAIGDNGVVGVAWEDIRYDQWTIHFAQSQDYGQTFSPSVRVDDDPDPACCPQTGGPSLVWKNDAFYLAFGGIFFGPGDSSISSGITFKYRPSDTGSFVTPVNASAADGIEALQGVPSLAINERGEAFVAWTDDRHDPFFKERVHIFGAFGHIRKGDLNLDGLLTLCDVVLELNAVFSNIPFPAPFDVADGNCDGILRPADLVLELRVVFLFEPFPC